MYRFPLMVVVPGLFLQLLGSLIQVARAEQDISLTSPSLGRSYAAWVNYCGTRVGGCNWHREYDCA